jgi:hypothetical protein
MGKTLIPSDKSHGNLPATQNNGDLEKQFEKVEPFPAKQQREKGDWDNPHASHEQPSSGAPEAFHERRDEKRNEIYGEKQLAQANHPAYDSDDHFDFLRSRIIVKPH